MMINKQHEHSTCDYLDFDFATIQLYDSDLTVQFESDEQNINTKELFTAYDPRLQFATQRIRIRLDSVYYTYDTYTSSFHQASHCMSPSHPSLLRTSLLHLSSRSRRRLQPPLHPLVRLFFIAVDNCIHTPSPISPFDATNNMSYHRSISFAPSSSSITTARSKFKARSASLPCRSSPLVSTLEEHSLSIRSWSRSSQSDGATWISNGLSMLSRLLSSLLDLLSHPQAAEPLRLHRSEKLLEDLLRLADALSCFRDGLLSLNQAVTETQSAVRRRDATRLAAAVRAQRRAEKQLSQLATSAREISRFSRFSTGNSEAVLTISIHDAVAVAALGSAGVFSCVVGMSVESVRDIADSVWDQWSGCPIASPARFSTPMTSPSVKGRKVWWVVDLLRWRLRSKKRWEKGRETKAAVPGQEEVKGEEMERRQALQRLHELERCISTTENGCTEIYRALVNARVSLLNILTPN